MALLTLLSSSHRRSNGTAGVWPNFFRTLILLSPLYCLQTVIAGHNRATAEATLSQRFKNYIVFGGQYVGVNNLPVEFSQDTSGARVTHQWCEKNCGKIGIDFTSFRKHSQFNDDADSLRAGVLTFRVWTGDSRVVREPTYCVFVPWIAVDTQRPQLPQPITTPTFFIENNAPGDVALRYFLVAAPPYGRPILQSLKLENAELLQKRFWYRWRLLTLKDGTTLLENADAPPDRARYLAADCAHRRSRSADDRKPGDLNVYLTKAPRGDYRQCRWAIQKQSSGSIVLRNHSAKPGDPPFLDGYCPRRALYTSPKTTGPYEATHWKLVPAK